MKSKINEKKKKNYIKEWIKEEQKPYSFEIILNNIRKKQIIKFLNKYNSENILEIGCGLEPLFLYYNNFDTYTIIEPSEVFCDYARNKIRGKFINRNINIIQGYIESVYKTLENYNFIILSSLLHEIPNPNEILQDVNKICDANTVVHINVPNVYSFHNLLGYEMGIIKDIFEESDTGIRFSRHTRFDKKILINMLEVNGFEIIEDGSYFIKPFTNKQMEKILKEKIVNEDIIEGLEKMIKYFPEFGAEIYANAKRK